MISTAAFEAAASPRIAIMASIRQDYIAAGGNRHPAAADWNGDLLAYGSGNNVAIWKPLDSQLGGVSALLSGHKDAVNAVKIIHRAQIDTPLIISGSGDKTVRVWASSSEKPCSYDEAACLTEHQGSVNTVAVLNDSHVFVTGGADATLRVWTLDISGQTPRTNGQPGHGSQNASVSRSHAPRCLRSERPCQMLSMLIRSTWADKHINR